MATKLFETADRNASHKKLEEILAAGTYPKAECREEIQKGNGPTLYQVWDGSGEAEAVAARPGPEVGLPTVEEPRVVTMKLSDEDVSRIAAAILAQQSK